MMTVNEKYDFLMTYLDEALAPHLQKYSGGGIKKGWDSLTSKMLAKWEAGARSKVTSQVRGKAKERIDAALRDPNYRKAMAKKYGLTIPAGTTPNVVKSTKKPIRDWPSRSQSS